MNDIHYSNHLLHLWFNLDLNSLVVLPVPQNTFFSELIRSFWDGLQCRVIAMIKHSIFNLIIL